MKGRKLIGLMSDLSKQLKKTCHTRRHNEILSERSKYADKDKTVKLLELSKHIEENIKCYHKRRRKKEVGLLCLGE